MKDWIMCSPYWIYWRRSVMRNFLIGLNPQKTVRTAFSFLALSLVVSSSAFSQSSDEQKWWFNVELIVFKRTMLSTNNENFEQAQFKLGSENSNNLLYLAALKQASVYRPMRSALLVCDAKQNSDVTFDFEYSPEMSSTLTTALAPSEKNIKVGLAGEDRQSEPQDNEVNDNPNFIRSNESMMKALLRPFLMPNIMKEDEIANGITSLAEPSALINDVEQIARQKQLNSLNNAFNQMTKQLFESENTLTRISCIDTSPQEVLLKQSVLPIIGPRLFSTTSQFTGTSQLLSIEDTAMQDYAQKVFKQRDIQPLLYTAWRQQVEFGIENAQFYKVRAGNKLETSQKPDYQAWHDQYQAKETNTAQDDETVFFNDLHSAIESNDKVDWLTIESSKKEDTDTAFTAKQTYEVEGQLKVYLEYVNQVPYLHIDNEFNHYRLVLDDKGSSLLEAFPFKQRRRIISKQIHYFDHPAFGLIVRLERFTPPVIDEVLIENSSNNE